MKLTFKASSKVHSSPDAALGPVSRADHNAGMYLCRMLSCMEFEGTHAVLFSSGWINVLHLWQHFRCIGCTAGIKSYGMQDAA